MKCRVFRKLPSLEQLEKKGAGVGGWMGVWKKTRPVQEGPLHRESSLDFLVYISGESTANFL